MEPLGGIWAASITPLHADLSVDHEGLNRHVQWLFDNGCHGAVLLGTTGEANSFTVSERVELMVRIADSGLPLDRIVAGTGCTALPDTIELTRRAHTLGFRAVLLLPPFYYKEVTDDGLYEGFQRMMDGIGAEGLRVLLYHFPRMAGVGYSLELISRLRAFYPDQVIGIKDSTGDAEHLVQLCTQFPGFSIITGTEKLLQLCLESGGAGCISASVNVTSRLCRRVYDSLSGANERAIDPEEIELISRFRAALDVVPLVAGMKYLMSIGIERTEWNFQRPPLMALNLEQISTLQAHLSELPTLPNFDVY